MHFASTSRKKKSPCRSPTSDSVWTWCCVRSRGPASKSPSNVTAQPTILVGKINWRTITENNCCAAQAMPSSVSGRVPGGPTPNRVPETLWRKSTKPSVTRTAHSDGKTSKAGAIRWPSSSRHPPTARSPSNPILQSLLGKLLNHPMRCPPGQPRHPQRRIPRVIRQRRSPFHLYLMLSGIRIRQWQLEHRTPQMKSKPPKKTRYKTEQPFTYLLPA